MYFFRVFCHFSGTHFGAFIFLNLLITQQWMTECLHNLQKSFNLWNCVSLKWINPITFTWISSRNIMITWGDMEFYQMESLWTICQSSSGLLSLYMRDIIDLIYLSFLSFIWWKLWRICKFCNVFSISMISQSTIRQIYNQTVIVRISNKLYDVGII